MNVQASAALRRANRVRVARAEERRAIRSMPSSAARQALAGRLEDGAWCAAGPAASARLVDVLEWLPYVGPVKARRLARLVGGSDSLRVRSLTGRQRRSLAAVLVSGGVERWAA